MLGRFVWINYKLKPNCKWHVPKVTTGALHWIWMKLTRLIYTPSQWITFTTYKVLPNSKRCGKYSRTMRLRSYKAMTSSRTELNDSVPFHTQSLVTSPSTLNVYKYYFLDSQYILVNNFQNDCQYGYSKPLCFH